MAELNQDHKPLIKVMADKVEPRIRRGLEGESQDFGFGNTPEGSNTFNAFTQACYLLGNHPNAPLANEVIEIDTPLSAVGRYLVNLVNDSLERDKVDEYNFSSKTRFVGEDACLEAERNFYVAMGHEGKYEVFPEDRKSKNVIYADDEGTPVLFKKAYGASTTLALEDLTLNSILYPSGTLFSSGTVRCAPHADYANGLQAQSLEDIASLVPIRMTKFGVPLTEQLSLYSGDIDDSEAHENYDMGFTLSLHDLKKPLPPASDIAKLVRELPKPGRYNNSAWQKELALTT